MNGALKNCLIKCLEFLRTESLKSAVKEQKLDGLVKRLEELVPDLSDQYSSFKVKGIFLNTKVRNMHAFQMSLIDRVINEFEQAVIVDVGDSSGTHLEYITALYSKDKDLKCLSVNLDIKAVERIKNKGFEAIHARAEDLHKHGVDADIFLCFEILEHMTDPCKFLYDLSSKTNAKYLIASVPYLKKSRVGLHHIRAGRKDKVNAENTHILELSPEDWKLVARHAGWEVVEDKIYFQYPKWSVWRFAKPLWKKLDFEGFYGIVLERNDSWSSLYQDW
jgi:2-polyprenyl-3-methyl-5-hydroxy-6-metoxy-1,4-benzoquinol methylase